jgi:YidC/Oxa1 family membrane protein insertase
MRKMQVLQPKIKELQDKYSKSPEKMNQEVMQLYRLHNVNPLGGCLPMLLQMPIFVGLYQVLWRSVYFRGEGFLWIKDLSLPDRLFKFPTNVPFIGEYFNILPVIMVVIMALQQRLSMKSVVTADPDQAMQQKLMATLFPVMIGVIFYNFSSGLNLYFVVFYLFSALTQWKIANSNPSS